MEYGIAIAGVAISAAAVWVTAIKVKAPPKNGDAFPCKEHSGIVAGIASIKQNQERQEDWLSEISRDVKELLKK